MVICRDPSDPNLETHRSLESLHHLCGIFRAGSIAAFRDVSARAAREVKTLWAKLVASKPVEAEAIVDVERLAAEGLR